MKLNIEYFDNFTAHLGLDDKVLFDDIIANTNWDSGMVSRKTASFGVAYNYSQMSYPFNPFTPTLSKLADAINDVLCFMPNNCLINYYLDGNSKMGYHSDQTDILSENTGVAIISLGATREIRFRNIEFPTDFRSVLLQSGSLFYMGQAVQSLWQHSIPKMKDCGGRLSLTFRKIKTQ